METVFEKFANSLPAFDKPKQPEQKEPEKESVEDLMRRAKRQIEITLNAYEYDRTGIKPEYWDFLIELAAERKVKAHLGGKEDPGRLTRESIGFILLGLPRSGKTFLMRILAELKAIPNPVGEAVLKNDYQAGGLDRLFNSYPAIRSKDFSLDDLGIIQDAKSFGNSGVIENILFERYEHWQGLHNCATFISSNLYSYGKLKEFFGEQLANRVFDMCVAIPVEGGNRGESAEKRFVFHSNNQ